MITAKFDQRKLERSLKKYAGEFGDTTSQAVTRWGVQICRELASDTIPWKNKGNIRKQHKQAIERDIGRVVFVMDRVPRKTTNRRIITNPVDLADFVDRKRVARNSRTPRTAPQDRMMCSRRVFDQAVRIKMKKAGIAKGGFIGAGQELASAQTGSDKINIGRNFLSYAHKHSGYGKADKPKSGFNPKAKVTNKASHSASNYVLSKASINRSVKFGLTKTIKWYRSALKRIDKKTS